MKWARRIGASILATVPCVLAGWLIQTLFEGPQFIQTVLILGVFWTTYLVVTLIFRRALTAQLLDVARSIFPGKSDPVSALGSAGHQP